MKRVACLQLAESQVDMENSLVRSEEDAALLAHWLAGPGARPTPDDTDRWLKATKDGLFPRRRLTSG